MASLSCRIHASSATEMAQGPDYLDFNKLSIASVSTCTSERRCGLSSLSFGETVASENVQDSDDATMEHESPCSHQREAPSKASQTPPEWSSELDEISESEEEPFSPCSPLFSGGSLSMWQTKCDANAIDVRERLDVNDDDFVQDPDYAGWEVDDYSVVDAIAEFAATRTGDVAQQHRQNVASASKLLHQQINSLTRAAFRLECPAETRAHYSRVRAELLMELERFNSEDVQVFSQIDHAHLSEAALKPSFGTPLPFLDVTTQTSTKHRYLSTRPRRRGMKRRSDTEENLDAVKRCSTPDAADRPMLFSRAEPASPSVTNLSSIGRAAYNTGRRSSLPCVRKLEKFEPYLPCIQSITDLSDMSDGYGSHFCD
eukprot:TRINITY_DN10316_c1_g1_i2.p1 TRINITY_DN10316_c1_g1~~TRINITY_DN10316_c1_g1_i2.p1  ORF type:complete len:372 (-),score=50.00 TRINITY_DN10316_c1_g1_i2:695-1810(-)